MLAAHTKQFKDSNFNVLKASFLGITNLLEAAHAAGVAKGNQAVVSTVVAPAVEKLGDRKLQVNKAATLVFRLSFFLCSLTGCINANAVLWLPLISMHPARGNMRLNRHAFVVSLSFIRFLCQN